MIFNNMYFLAVMNSESAHMLALSVGRPQVPDLINSKTSSHKHHNGHIFNNNHHSMYNRHLPETTCTYTTAAGSDSVSDSQGHGHYDDPSLYNSVGMDRSFPPPPSPIVTPKSPSRGNQLYLYII